MRQQVIRRGALAAPQPDVIAVGEGARMEAGVRAIRVGARMDADTREITPEARFEELAHRERQRHSASGQGARPEHRRIRLTGSGSLPAYQVRLLVSTPLAPGLDRAARGRGRRCLRIRHPHDAIGDRVRFTFERIVDRTDRDLGLNFPSLGLAGRTRPLLAALALPLQPEQRLIAEQPWPQRIAAPPAVPPPIIGRGRICEAFVAIGMNRQQSLGRLISERPLRLEL
jgi:hypothetical protein